MVQIPSAYNITQSYGAEQVPVFPLITEIERKITYEILYPNLYNF